MFGMGIPELLVIMVIVFVLFGAGKLPEVGKALGKGIRSFKKEMNSLDDALKTDTEPEKETPAKD